MKFEQVNYTEPFTWEEHNNLKYSIETVKGLTEYVRCVETRYTPAFMYYITDTIIGQSLRHYGEYTQIEIDLLNNFINPNTIVYDIGANIGYHTLGLAQNAKHVYAFEPNNKNYFLLRHNTKNCTNITNYNVALGNEHKKVYISDFNMDQHGNYGECMILEDGHDNGQEIDCYPLDSFIKQHNIPEPHLVKMDVEGYEYDVIRGMMKTLEKCNPIIFYEHLHGVHLPDIYDVLVDKGYTIYWYPVPNYNPRNYKQNMNNIFGHGGVCNALAVPRTINLQTNLYKKTHRDQTWSDVANELLKNAKHN